MNPTHKKNYEIFTRVPSSRRCHWARSLGYKLHLDKTVETDTVPPKRIWEVWIQIDSKIQQCVFLGK